MRRDYISIFPRRAGKIDNNFECEERGIDDVKKLLIQHLSPKPTKHTLRFRFYRTMQTSSESASGYIARLRTIANDCEFTDFENALLDQFLVGLKDQNGDGRYQELSTKLCMVE